MLLPGAIIEYMQSPCVVIPVKKDGLLITMTTRDERSVMVNWERGKAWEILQDVRIAAVKKEGGTFLLLRV